MEKFVFLTDLHWGYERVGGHKVPVHDIKALNVALGFIKDFKPDHIILGGDMLDCGSISHWTADTPGEVEGMRLFQEAKELRDNLIIPCEKSGVSLTYIEGNHEDWLNHFVAKHPALEGIVEIGNLLRLDEELWQVVRQGQAYQLGKLTFIHGDQVKGGANHALWATNAYEASVRFGHFHTFQVAAKTAQLKANGHTGMSVPCLCKRGPKYGKGAPNSWMQGFLFGWVDSKSFNDYPVVIVDGKATIQGKTYHG